MAEKLLQKVEAELITCSICLDTYANPKLLQCFHVYCQGCLARLVFRDQQGQLVLSCPECRKVTPVPTGRVANLQSAFHINHLLGIMEEHKKALESAHTENSVSSNYTIQDISRFSCSEHHDEELKLYCETCEKMICFKCVIKGEQHHDHQYELLNKAFEKYKEEINSLLKPVEKQMVTVQKTLNEIETCHMEITDQQASIEASVHSSIGRLQEILEARKTQLINKLHQVIQGKLKNLAAQKDQLETILAQLGSCHDFMNKSIESDSHRDVLKMKTRIVNQVTELTAPIKPYFLKPCTEADLVYSDSVSATIDCQNYGQLFGPSLSDPSQCYATGQGLKVATIDETATANLHAVNYKGESCNQPISSLQCELISELGDKRVVLGNVEKMEETKYEISYQPTIKGRHSLHIKVEGQHIKGSPFHVAVKLFRKHHDGPIGGVRGPYGVALTHTQELIVSSLCDHCIHSITSDGKKLRSFGSYGSGHGQFRNPVCVAVDKDGNILVVDNKNHRVQKFTADGKFLRSVGTKGKKKLQFDHPYGIAISNATNKIYVADSLNNRVQVLTSDLNFSGIFGSEGHGNGQLYNPKDITFDRTGRLYISDGHHRVQSFTENGEFLGVIGGYGKGEGRLDLPAGMAVDDDGILYVSDDGNQRISVFTSDGQFVRTFEGNSSLVTPRGLAVDESGVVYVCDVSKNCILLFSL